MITFTHTDGQTYPISFVTSDQHVGHKNIAKYTGRPFDNSVSTEQMDAALRHYWNEMVTPEDNVLLLGDVALGSLEASLNNWKTFNGTKFLVPGNHDRVSSVEKESRRLNAAARYEDAGFIILPEVVAILVDGVKVLASHYPYSGDSHDGDRYTHLRPVDEGGLLVHGHTHSKKAVDPDEFPRQFHVGVDSHDLKPVPASVIEAWVASHQ